METHVLKFQKGKFKFDLCVHVFNSLIWSLKIKFYLNIMLLCSVNQKLSLAQERLQLDFDKLKQEEQEKTQKLQELT